MTVYTEETTTCPIRLAGDFHLEARRCEDCDVARLARLSIGAVGLLYQTGRATQDTFEGYSLAWALLSPTGDPERVTLPDSPDVRRIARKLIRAKGLAVPARLVEEIGPADFAPYRAEITDCHCAACREIAYASSSVLDGPGSARSLAACRALLAELRAGTHKPMTLAERAAEARQEKAERLAALRAAGAPQTEIDAVERGYVAVPMAFTREGIFR